MLAVATHTVSLFVDRTTQQWILRDTAGIYWVLPAVENAWERRRPFELTDKTNLEPIPGHYKYLFQLPF